MVSILRQVQDQVASQLSSSEQLSACQILVEDSRDIDFEIKNALGRQGLVLVVTTPKATFAGKLEDQSLAWQLDQLEIDCVENVPVNRGRLSGDFITAQEAAMSVFDVLCPLEGSREGQIHPVSYEQGQDHGLLVSRCILKCLVTGESSGPGPGPEPISMTFVKLLEEAPPEGVLRKDGWMWPTDEGFVIWQDGQAHALGVSMDQVSAYVDSRLSGYLPALNNGNYSTVDKFLSITSPANNDDSPVLEVVKNKGSQNQRVLELIASTPPSYDGWGLTMGFDSNGQPQFKFGSDDYFYEGGNVIKLPRKDGIVALEQDLSAYLPISGGIMYGTIEFSPDSDWEHNLGYKLIQLNKTGENWQALFGVDDNHGQPYVAHNGSETGTGEIQEYTWKLWFPDENGTLATREWTQGEISGKADLSGLSGYLPLSGGSMEGPIQMGSDDGNRLYFDNHSIVYGSPDSIGFFTDNNRHGAYLDLYHTLPLSDGVDYIAYRRDIDQAISAFIKATAMTQAEYDQITPDPTTLYVITES